MINNLFNLKDRVAIITGGAGLLGQKHAEIIAQAGGCPIIIDINEENAKNTAEQINKQFNTNAIGLRVDITDKESIKQAVEIVLKEKNRIDVLINNAANNPKVELGHDQSFDRLENFSYENWQNDINVGLTGAFFCSQIIGFQMAKQRNGVILNISSDLGVVAPDQRLYKKDNLPAEKQPVKPVTYSVIKHGLIGLTKYLATYWADCNVRANALSPGGIDNNQPEEFKAKVNFRIPLGRMAHKDEYMGAVLFLVSDASSYMTGANLIIDGGRTCW